MFNIALGGKLVQHLPLQTLAERRAGGDQNCDDQQHDAQQQADDTGNIHRVRVVVVCLRTVPPPRGGLARMRRKDM